MPNRTTRARTAGTTRRTRRRQVTAVNASTTARRSRKPTSTQDDIAGQIMWLPSPAEVICDTPLVLDEGCFNHPVLILSSCPDKNKHVRILIVTSFHSTSLSDKHKRHSAVRKLYLPIHPTAPHADLDGTVLYLEGDRELLKKSYVNLAKKWSVPFKILRGYPYGYDQGDRQYKLTKESLKTVMGMIPQGPGEEDDDEEGMDPVHSAASSCAAQVGTIAPKPAPALDAEVLMAAARVREMAAGQAAPPRHYQAWGAQAASSSARPTVPRSSSATIPREAALAASAARYYSDNSRRPLLAAATNPSAASAAPHHPALVNPLANWMDPSLRTATSPATPNYGATLERLAQRQQQHRQQQTRPVDSIGLQRSATYPAPGSYNTRQQRSVNGYYYPSPGETRRPSAVGPAAEDGGPKWLQVISVVVFIGFVVGVLWLLGYLALLAWPFAKAAFGWFVGALGWALSHGSKFLVEAGQKLMEIWLKIWHWLIGKTVQGSGLQKGTVFLGRYNAMLRGE